MRLGKYFSHQSSQDIWDSAGCKCTTLEDILHGIPQFRYNVHLSRLVKCMGSLMYEIWWKKFGAYHSEKHYFRLKWRCLSAGRRKRRLETNRHYQLKGIRGKWAHERGFQFHTVVNFICKHVCKTGFTIAFGIADFSDDEKRWCVDCLL